MRAVIYDRHGSPDVLRLEDVPQPIPKEDEVLVKVQATTVETRQKTGNVVLTVASSKGGQ